jgi:steroid Delta-isomerase
MADADRIRHTIARYPTLLAGDDKDAWLQLFADDATAEDPVGTPLRTGRGQIGGLWDLIHGLGGDTELVITNDPKVCGHEAAFGLQVRAMMGDTRMAMDIIDVMTFDDEARITSLRTYFEPATMAPLDDAGP